MAWIFPSSITNDVTVASSIKNLAVFEMARFFVETDEKNCHILRKYGIVALTTMVYGDIIVIELLG